MQLGLYGGEIDSEEARFDAHLLNLSSITEVDWTGNVLTLAHVDQQVKRRFAEFIGDVVVNYVWEPGTDEDFTHFPLQVFVQEGKGQHAKFFGFRIDHTPTGYAALRALGCPIT